MFFGNRVNFFSFFFPVSVFYYSLSAHIELVIVKANIEAITAHAKDVTIHIAHVQHA